MTAVDFIVYVCIEALIPILIVTLLSAFGVIYYIEYINYCSVGYLNKFLEMISFMISLVPAQGEKSNTCLKREMSPGAPPKSPAYPPVSGALGSHGHIAVEGSHTNSHSLHAAVGLCCRCQSMCPSHAAWPWHIAQRRSVPLRPGPTQHDVQQAER